jgi:non-canonical purine NTP pyrophosphatase (RdgB/HAM1 family)
MHSDNLLQKEHQAAAQLSHTLCYVTSNDYKIAEAHRYCTRHAPQVTFERHVHDLPEIQSMHQVEIATKKAEAAWSILQRPVLVDDSGLFIERLNGFPGTASKHAMETLGFAGIMHLINDQEPAYFSVTIAYAYGPGLIKTFQGRTDGNLKKVEKLPEGDSMPYSKLFVPVGQPLPFAEIRGTADEKIYGPRNRALDKFFAWFETQINK